MLTMNFWEYFNINPTSEIDLLENAYMNKFIEIEENFSIDNAQVINNLLLCNKAFITLLRPSTRFEHDNCNNSFKLFGFSTEKYIFNDNEIFDNWLIETYTKYFNICKEASQSSLTWNTNIMNILQIAIGLNQEIEYIKKEKDLTRTR